MIEQLNGFPDKTIGFVCHGHVTKADYDAILVPAVLDALGRRNKIRRYYETAADFTGFDPGAMWEDFKVGVEHLTHWERVAVVSDIDWIKQSTRLFSFLMPGTVKAFSASESARARAWLAAG